MIRDTQAEDQEREDMRAQDIMRWGAVMVAALALVVDEDENRLINLVFDHWLKYHQGPSRQTLEDMVRAQDLPENLLSLLNDYDKYQSQMPASIDATEIENVYKTRHESWNRQRLVHHLYQSKVIAEVGMPGNRWNEPVRKGVKDARQYLLAELSAGGWVPGDKPQGGDMFLAAENLLPMYREMAEANRDNRLTIRTFIPLIDDAMGGLERRTLNLVMGHTGHRKSAVCRTMAYYAALAGFRVLFIPLEWPYDEEWRIFSVMHANLFVPVLPGLQNLSLERFQKSQLTQEELEQIERLLLPTLCKLLGPDLVIRSSDDHTWPAIRQLIEQENRKQELDMVVIDYLGMLDLGDARDKVHLMHQHIREIKQMTIRFNNGRGLVVVSPVQCNRKGYETACANGGVWESTDIYLYSEMEKSADNILYTYMPDHLKVDNQLMIGFCKTRRHGVIAPLTVTVDPRAGLVGGSPVAKARGVVPPPVKKPKTKSLSFSDYVREISRRAEMR